MQLFIAKVEFVSFRKLVLFLCVLCGLCVNITAQEWRTVHDGVEYAEVTREISGLKVNINLLRLDLKKVRLDVHHAMDAAIGTEKTSSIATRHGAVAAINAGFFRLDNSIWAGDPVGALMIDGNLLSEHFKKRIALIIREKPLWQETLAIERLDAGIQLDISGAAWRVDDINGERKENSIVVYTPMFHRTTLTDSNGSEVIVRRNRVFSVRNDAGNSVIPSDGFVISISGTQREVILKRLKRDTRIRIRQLAIGKNEEDTSFSQLIASNMLIKTATDIVAGVPQLIKDGKIAITWQEEGASKSFVETRHPRTAVAKLKDGKFLMITVDGRSESSGGISLYDLANYLLSLGAIDAMNLDGGGSTTMFLDGKVVNHPSDKDGERRVSDAILVTLRNPRK